MKKLTFLLSALSLYSVTHAQPSGTIIYKETARLHFNIQGDAPPPPDLPTERNAHMILYYTPEASLYMNDPAAKNAAGFEQEESGDGEQIRIRMEAPDNRTYCDLKEGIMIQQQDFMQRKFIIETPVKTSDWKLTGNHKMVLDFSCQEATRELDGKKVIAWFASAIPLSSGPSSFCGLPGMVLEVNINDGDQNITATSVKQGEVDAAKILKPKDGKKVTQEEFNKIRDEKLKEMGVVPGGGNQVIIRIDNR
jgi:GLPGLI family protein